MLDRIIAKNTFALFWFYEGAYQKIGNENLEKVNKKRLTKTVSLCGG